MKSKKTIFVSGPMFLGKSCSVSWVENVPELWHVLLLKLYNEKSADTFCMGAQIFFFVFRRTWYIFRFLIKNEDACFRIFRNSPSMGLKKGGNLVSSSASGDKLFPFVPTSVVRCTLLVVFQLRMKRFLFCLILFDRWVTEECS